MSANIPEGADTDPKNPANAVDFKRYRTVRLTIDFPIFETADMAEHQATKTIEVWHRHRAGFGCCGCRHDVNHILS